MFGFGKKDYFKPGPDGRAPVIAFVSKAVTVPVYDVPAVVGRDSSQVDVLINDATVSRKHLYIGTYENKLTVTDQGSTAGTVINGETLEPGVPYYLSEGDKVTIGKLNFVCHLNKERTGKKLKLPSFIPKETAGDTSEMDKADIAAAASQLDGAAENIDDAANEEELESAAEVVKEAEMASEPVIKLMSDPVLDEIGDEQQEAEEPDESDEENQEDPVSELEAENERPAETIDVMRSGHAHMPGARFVYYSGHTAVESFDITATPFVIGRAKSDYTPGAAGVSRRHCFIDRTGSIFYITDLESTNGVWINGRRIKPYNRTALESGDIVGIGDRVYKFEMDQ